MWKSEQEPRSVVTEEYDSTDARYYLCPICGKILRYIVHPSMGEKWSRGRVRGKHLRSHGIDHRFISPARKDDPLFIRTLFRWNQICRSRAVSMKWRAV